ncbi:MAG: hypothetical protein AUH41_11840 [Gemmatimonadetes bacterium 13_1_40CM_66_11]|nr:MAG: hypothetical protein AUH41_11840 [Gemmatimonadetes bacterium 13_1_40CM_66_11]
MADKDRLKLIFHGAIVLLVGLLCGLPTAIEASTESVRFWHTAHEALIMMGIWILAASSVRPVLLLDGREATALVWSLLAMGYGFMTALVMGGIIGISPFAPGGTAATFIAFLSAVVGILGAFVATAVTLMGVRAALDSHVAVPPT